MEVLEKTIQFHWKAKKKQYNSRNGYLLTLQNELPAKYQKAKKKTSADPTSII